MRSIFWVLIIAGLIITGCKSNPKKEEQKLVETGEQVQPDGHNAQNSIDYKGTYKGVVPCADCEGIETIVVLTDKEFVRKTQYLGKDTKVFEEKGVFTWKNGNIIVFEDITNAPNQYFVGENMIKQLDMEGNVITGDLADRYILTKQ